jgi:hypothetical protein
VTADLEKLVKPLVWEESLRGRWIGTPPFVKLGNLAFWIFQNHDGTFKRVSNKVWLYYSSIDAAKAAAQADYAARIAAALDPDAVARMVQEAERQTYKDCVDANTRADRAEAALAAQIEADAEIADGFHQRAIEWAKSVRGLEKHIGETDSSRIAASIRNQPNDRTALDRMLAEAREKALREAAAVCLAVSVDPLTQAGREHAPWMKATAEDCSRAILALIEKPNAR